VSVALCNYGTLAEPRKASLELGIGRGNGFTRCEITNMFEKVQSIPVGTASQSGHINPEAPFPYPGFVGAVWK
jgi:hypothetical protein